MPETILDSNNSVDGIQGVPAPIILVGQQTRAGPLKDSRPSSANVVPANAMAARTSQTASHTAAVTAAQGSDIKQDAAISKGSETRSASAAGAASQAAPGKPSAKNEAVDVDEMVPQLSASSAEFLASFRSQYNRAPANAEPAEQTASLRGSANPMMSVSTSTRFGPIWDHPEDNLPPPAKASTEVSAFQGMHASQSAQPVGTDWSSHPPPFTSAHYIPSNLVRESSGPLARAGSDAEMLHERSHLAESSSPSKVVRVIERAGSGNIPASNVTLGHHTRMGGFEDSGDQNGSQFGADFGHHMADSHPRSHLAPQEVTSSHYPHNHNARDPHAAALVGPPRLEQHAHETKTHNQEYSTASFDTKTFHPENREREFAAGRQPADSFVHKAAAPEAAQEAFNRDIRIVDRQGSGPIPTSKVTLGTKTRAGGFDDYPMDPRPSSQHAGAPQPGPWMARQNPITPQGAAAGSEISFSTPKRPTGVAERSGLSSHAIELSADKYGRDHEGHMLDTPGDVYTTARSMPSPMLVKGPVSILRVES